MPPQAYDVNDVRKQRQKRCQKHAGDTESQTSKQDERWDCARTYWDQTLGADPYLPGRHIESFLRVFEQFACNIPRG